VGAGTTRIPGTPPFYRVRTARAPYCPTYATCATTFDHTPPFPTTPPPLLLAPRHLADIIFCYRYYHFAILRRHYLLPLPLPRAPRCFTYRVLHCIRLTTARPCTLMTFSTTWNWDTGRRDRELQNVACTGCTVDRDMAGPDAMYSVDLSRLFISAVYTTPLSPCIPPLPVTRFFCALFSAGLPTTTAIPFHPFCALSRYLDNEHIERAVRTVVANTIGLPAAGDVLTHVHATHLRITTVTPQRVRGTRSRFYSTGFRRATFRAARVC